MTQHSITDDVPPIVDSLVELAGRTPLLRLGSIAARSRADILVKLEYLNPGGSVKDRPAFAMVDAAERDGTLRPGGTIVEATAGNTGAGLAIAAAGKGYRCVFVVSDKVAPEKQNLLKAFGAEVVVAPYNVAPDDPRSYYSVTDRLVATIPGAVKLDQYRNPQNPGAHAATTGPEIWQQTAGRITHLVAGVGTGGTISGTASYLKSRNPEVVVVGVEPHGSVFSGDAARPYLVEGVGEDFWPETFDSGLVDRIIQVSDAESFHAARTLAREQGALTGGSSGAAVAGALRLATELDDGAVVVAILPDGGRGYLSRFYDDQWMTDHGFLRHDGSTVADLLTARPAEATLVTVGTNDTLGTVASTLARHRVGRVFVTDAAEPLVVGDLAGAITADALHAALERNPADLDTPVSAALELAAPKVLGVGERLEVAAVRLAGDGPLPVLDEGRVVGVVSLSDVVAFRSST